MSNETWTYPRAVHRFLDHLRSARRSAPATIDAYRRDLAAFGRSLSTSSSCVNVADISSVDAYRWVEEMKPLASSTVCRRLSALSMFFRVGIVLGYATVNPVDSVVRPDVRKRIMPCPSPQDVRQLIAAAREGRERVVLLTLLTTGLRRGELLATHRGDLDLGRRRLRIRGKGDKEREVIISDELAVMLVEHLRGRPVEDDGALFRGRCGSALSKTTLQRWFQKWVTTAGLQMKGYTLHSLRRFAATRWLTHGLNVRQIQVLLGHEDLDTTARYLNFDLDEIAQDMDASLPRMCDAPVAEGGSAMNAGTSPHIDSDTESNGELVRGLVSLLRTLPPETRTAVAQAASDGSDG